MGNPVSEEFVNTQKVTFRAARHTVVGKILGDLAIGTLGRAEGVVGTVRRKVESTMHSVSVLGRGLARADDGVNTLVDKGERAGKPEFLTC